MTLRFEARIRPALGAGEAVSNQAELTVRGQPGATSRTIPPPSPRRIRRSS
ncbi:MAG: hypothetical protein R3F43_24355 [bacterium]